MREFLGFTLIELLLVIALIGILSLVAYPSYNRHLLRVRRVYITKVLLDVASKMEEYYLANHGYSGAGKKLLIDDSRYCNYYDVQIEEKDDYYLLQAIPRGRQRQDLMCGTLIFDHNGKRSVTGSAENVSKCWL